MSMDLGVKTFQHVEEYFEAGPHPIAKAVKTAAVNIPAHSPVILNSAGKLALLTAPSGSDPVNTTGIYGVTPEAAAANEEAVVYLTGEFFKDSIALPDGIAVADVEVALRNIGIFLK